MRKYKVVYRKPTIPRGFGKKRKQKKHFDYGALLEAIIIFILIFIFLWACFGTKAHARCVALEPIGGSKPTGKLENRYESYFNDDSRSATLFHSINRIREANGIPALEFDYEMSDFAYVRAQESSVQWSHTRPNGETVTQENLGKYFGLYYENPAEKVAEVWANHSGHRETMLNPNFHYVGIGTYIDGNGLDYYCAEFR